MVAQSGFSDLDVITSDDPEFCVSFPSSVRVPIGRLSFAEKLRDPYVFTRLKGETSLRELQSGHAFRLIRLEK